MVGIVKKKMTTPGSPGKLHELGRFFLCRHAAFVDLCDALGVKGMLREI